MDVKEKLMQYLDNKGVSPTKAEQLLGWGKGALIKAKSISVDRTGEFLLLFEDLSAEWLLRGQGEMIRTESSENTEELKAEINQLKGENRILREQVGLGERKSKSAS